MEESTVGTFRYGAYLEPGKYGRLRIAQITFTDAGLYVIAAAPQFNMPKESLKDAFIENLEHFKGYNEWMALKAQVKPSVDYKHAAVTDDMRKDKNVLYGMKNSDVKKIAIYKYGRSMNDDYALEMSGEFLGLVNRDFFVQAGAAQAIAELVKKTPLAQKLQVAP